MNSNSHTGTALAFPATGGCSPGLPSPGITTRDYYPETNDLFYMELRYDQPFDNTTSGGNITGITGFAAQKAGNISQLAWRVRGRDRQAYNFTYDHLSRDTLAVYYDVNASNVASTINRFNEKLTYDLRGNISALQRNGYYSSSCNYGQIDNLAYTYTPNTNRIATITESAPMSQQSHGFNPGSGGAGYGYDANGNLKSDTYKGISNISYNHLNLPSVVTYSNGNTIEFVYDAAGMKLRKIVKVGATVQYEQDYAGGLEYRKVGAAGSKRIEAVYHAEGRYYNLNVEVNNTLNWRKEYALRDHLGNTRLMFADKNANGIVDVTNSASTNDILQESHYYPFGLSYEGPWLMNDAARDNSYKYNGKELNEDFGLNWNDHGARFYDPAIGRWEHVDPMADYTPNWTPYRFGFNNPLIFSDPTGLSETDPDEVGRELTYGENGVVNGVNIYYYSNDEDEDESIFGDFSSNQSDWLKKAFKGHNNGDGCPICQAQIPEGQENAHYFYLHSRDEEKENYKTLKVLEETFTTFYPIPGALGLAKKGKNIHSVYRAVVNGEIIYVGITSNIARRAAEHLRGKGLDIRPLLQNLNRSDARAVEQALIEIHKLSKNEGTLLNEINSISKTNPNYAKQLKRGFNLLKNIGY